jgi:DNA-binding transcriptional LysR family regulator
MADKFEDVRTFVAVVQGRGFNAAARQLGFVKSAVSRRIRELEDRLGTRLLNRTTRTITLTESGTEFYARSLRLLADLQEAEDIASQGAHEAVGRLRISTPVSFTIHCLAPALKAFQEANPKLELELETNDRKIDLVGEGFDLALRISRLKDSSLVARRLAPIRHVVCASPAYWRERGRPKEPKDLRAHSGIAYSYVDSRSYWLFKGDESVDVKSTLILSNGDAIREAAIAGCGVAYLPTFIIYRAVERGELVPVLTEYARPEITLNAIYPSNRNVPTKVRKFIDFCVEQFGEEPFWDQQIFGAGKRTK